VNAVKTSHTVLLDHPDRSHLMASSGALNIGSASSLALKRARGASNAMAVAPMTPTAGKGNGSTTSPALVPAKCVELQDGYELLGTAHGCKQALSMAKELRPDLIVLDVYLPDRSGLEVIRGVRAAKLPCDFILITAARELQIVEEAFRAGIFDYLVKPFRLDLLEGALRKYRAFRAHLRSSQTVDQGFVDGLRSARAARVLEPPQTQKGIDARTLERVGQVLKDVPEPSSAERIAELAGVSRSTARTYLHHLVERGEAEETLQYGAVGRPQLLLRAKR
jgi:response regulator of citrate/malate metabolism